LGELVLRTTAFEEIEDMVDHGFDLDGNAGNAVDSQVEDSCSEGDFLKKDVSGRHTILYPNLSKLTDVVKHYWECKAKAPDSSSLCLVVPVRPDVASTLAGFRLLKEYAPSSNIIERRCPDGKKVVPYHTKGKLQVWYDCPEVDPRDKSLKMQFHGQVAGQPAKILVDTGASGNFCGKEYAQKAGLRWTPGREASVMLPDGTTHTVYGYLHVQCKIQGFTHCSSRGRT
jgi:hypothetical protein